MQRINHNVSEAVYDLFDEMCNDYKTVPKYRVVEAAIYCFAALPKKARMLLIVQDEQAQQVILDHIRKLQLKDLE